MYVSHKTQFKVLCDTQIDYAYGHKRHVITVDGGQKSLCLLCNKL